MLRACLLAGLFFATALEAGVSGPRKFRLEFFDATFRIDEFLLSSVEGVAGTANIDLQFLPRASGLKGITTTALHVRLKIFWMDFFFHDCNLNAGHDPAGLLFPGLNLTRLRPADKTSGVLWLPHRLLHRPLNPRINRGRSRVGQGERIARIAKSRNRPPHRGNRPLPLTFPSWPPSPYR